MQEQSVIDTTAHLASMTERAKILAGPDYFTCQRTHARIKKTECVTRQTEGAYVEGSWKKEIPPECKECEQGKEISSQLTGVGGQRPGEETMPTKAEIIKERKKGPNENIAMEENGDNNQ